MPKVKYALFTISDAEYSALALTMFDSVAKHYHDSDLFLFIFGTGTAKKISGTNINVIYIGDILDELDLNQRLAFYLQVELVTSVRPQCFEFLFANGYDKAIYLDPDLYIFRRMTEVDELLNGEVNGIVTPHALKSVNSTIGGDNVFLQCGIFNLGFLALKKTNETIRMLAWWKEKLKWHCIVDWQGGYFVDQKWLEFLPIYFDGFHILKLPTYNLAPWNSEHYKILIDYSGQFFIDDFNTPIAFIHYSGIKRSTQHYLYMKEAYEFYLKELSKHRFVHLDFVNYEVRFEHNNLYLDKICITVYKQYVRDTKDTTSDPLTDSKFLTYLYSIDGETKLPRYIRKLYEILPDFFVRMNKEINYNNLIGIIQNNFHYDYVVNMETIAQLCIDNGVINVNNTQFIGDINGQSQYYPAIALLCGNKTIQILPKTDRIEIVSGNVRVCIPFIDESMALSGNFSVQNQDYTEIWVPNDMYKNIFQNKYNVTNITIIPYPVIKPLYNVLPTNLPNNKFVVMLRCDFNYGNVTNNLFDVVEAFEKAFGTKDDALLVCFVINVKSAIYHKLISTLQCKTNIVIVEGTQNDNMYYSYLHNAHCFLSLQHQEISMSRVITDVLSLGKYVITTNKSIYSNMEGVFLEEGINEVMNKLISIYSDISILHTKNKQIKRCIQKTLSPSIVGFIMQQRINELCGITKPKKTMKSLWIYKQLRSFETFVRLQVKSSFLYQKLHNFEIYIRKNLKKIPLFAFLYRKLSRKKIKIKPDKLLHSNNDTMVTILLKNVNRPAIIE